MSSSPSADITLPPETASRATDSRPWPRFWARFIDNSIFFVLIAPIVANLEGLAIAIVPLALWCPVEAVLLSTWGTTPGKALLRVQLRSEDGQRLGFRRALQRAGDVWLRGYGLGLLAPITLIIAYVRFGSRGHTGWDAKCRTVVRQGDIGIGRIVAAILVLIACIGAVAISVDIP